MRNFVLYLRMHRGRKLRRKSVLCVLLCLLTACSLLLPVAAAEDTAALPVGVDTLDGKKAAALTGTPHAEIINQNVKDASIYYFNSNTDCALALREKKVDFFINNTIQFDFIRQEYPEFSYIDQTLITYENGAIFTKDAAGAALRDEFNTFLASFTESGKLEELKSYWLEPNDWEAPELPTQGSRGTLTVATCTAMKPFALSIDGSYGGFDVALVGEFCKEAGYALKIEDVDFAGMISGIVSGKYDIAAGQIAWTEERDQNVYYSNLYVAQDIVFYVRTADYIEAENDTEETLTLWEKAERSFRRTFIEESRWKMILRGIGVTLLISLCGFALANICGALFAAMALSGKKFLMLLADIYSRVMQGTPIVVILLILYYVIFGNSNLSGVVISIFGFGISVGAYLSQLFAGGIRAVEVGQTEAALMLGMTPCRAFFGIVLPQTVRSILPGYFSQFISLMKGTSVVGYIAVSDLTKASDIIRSNTYEAFFPLIASAAIYFVISCLLLSLLKAIRKRLEPRRRGEGKESGK